MIGNISKVGYEGSGVIEMNKNINLTEVKKEKEKKIYRKNKHKFKQEEKKVICSNKGCWSGLVFVILSKL